MLKLFVVLAILQLGTGALLDEVNEELASLRLLIVGKIAIAHENLDTTSTDLSTHGDNVITDGNIAIDQVHDRVTTQLDQIKAANAGKDISYCTGGREQMVYSLQGQLKDRLKVCVVGNVDLTAEIVASSKYIVDVVINEVSSLEFQVQRCGTDDLLCLSPLLEKVNLLTADLPERIDGEVQSCQGQVDTLSSEVSVCQDTHVADYTGYVTALVDEIEKCIQTMPCFGPLC